MLLLFSHSAVSDSLQPHGLQPTRLLCPWDSPGKNTGLWCHFLLQGIFSTQVSNLHLLQWQADSLPLSRQGSPRLNESAQSHKTGRGGAKLYTHELWISASFLEVARRLGKVFQVCWPRGRISYMLSLYILQICLLTRSLILVLIFSRFFFFFFLDRFMPSQRWSSYFWKSIWVNLSDLSLGRLSGVCVFVCVYAPTNTHLVLSAPSSKASLSYCLLRKNNIATRCQAD